MGDRGAGAGVEEGKEPCWLIARSTSSAEAMELQTSYPRIPRARPIAEVSQFSVAEVLLIMPELRYSSA